MSNPKTAPDFRLGSFCYLPRALSWGGMAFHMCANQLLKFYKAPLAGKVIIASQISGLSGETPAP